MTDSEEILSGEADALGDREPETDGREQGTGNREQEAEDEASHARPDDAIDIQPQRVVEAILFASDSPLAPAKIATILGVGDARDVRKHIAALNEQYAAGGVSFRIEEIAGGFQMMTLPAYNTWLTKLLRAKEETKLSPAALETLAIVAYKQPVTRADIEAIRGVAAGDMLQRLRELGLVKIVGRAEDLGRPLLYGTTKQFLEVFGLPSLEDLPQVEALKTKGTGIREQGTDRQTGGTGNTEEGIERSAMESNSETQSETQIQDSTPQLRIANED